MIKVGRITYIIGSIAFLFIGVMHTYVQLTELAGEELRQRFEAIGPIALQGDMVSAWDLFQGVSLLMGFFSIAVGLLLLANFRFSTPRDKAPSPAICLATILLLTAIAVIGWLYLSSFQVIGGIAGIICFTLPIIADRSIR